MAGFISEWWPGSNRNGGRHQIGIPGRIASEFAREVLDPRLLELMPPLAALCPPATVIDKTRYSAFAELGLIEHLRQREADALVVSGSETDVCVLATVLDAVDIGYRVIVVRDAV